MYISMYSVMCNLNINLISSSKNHRDYSYISTTINQKIQ